MIKRKKQTQKSLLCDVLQTYLFFLCRSVVVPVKKPPPGSLAVTTVGAATAGGGLPPGTTPNIFAATGATPKSMINTTGIVLKYFCDPHFFFVFLSYCLFSVFNGLLKTKKN